MRGEDNGSEKKRDDNAEIAYPFLIWIVYILDIFDEREEEPRDHHSQDRIEVERNTREDIESYEPERESSYSKEESGIIEKEEYGKCSLCDDEFYLEIFFMVFYESFTDVLDFNHFSL